MADGLVGCGPAVRPDPERRALPRALSTCVAVGVSVHPAFAGPNKSCLTPECLEFPRLARPEAVHHGQSYHPGEAVRRATLISSASSPAPSSAQWPRLRAARPRTSIRPGCGCGPDTEQTTLDSVATHCNQLLVRWAVALKHGKILGDYSEVIRRYQTLRRSAGAGSIRFGSALIPNHLRRLH